MKEIKLTYFTPTYNRANLLSILYQTLCKQTNKNFIWLVVDDGSTDNTKEVVEGFINENIIQIDYHYKENGGKNTAIDYSNQVCTTEYIACIDSDDYLEETTTEVLYSKFDLCKNNEIVGLIGPRKMLNEGMDYSWDIDNKIMYFYDLSKYIGNIPDTFLIFKTNIVKQFSFPKFKEEKFITESVLYNKFFYDYKFLVFSEKLYISEYMADGYTNQGLKLFVKNPKGYAYALKQNTSIAINKKQGFKKALKSAIYYYSWISYSKLKDKDFKDYNINFPYNFLGKLITPLGKIILKKKLKG